MGCHFLFQGGSLQHRDPPTSPAWQPNSLPLSHQGSNKMIQSPWKPVWQSLKKLNKELPHNLEILLLVIYPRETKTNVHTKTCALMFREALFIIVKKWKKLKSPLTNEWINKMWYRHVISFSLKKKVNSDKCCSVDEHWEHYTKWNKPVTKR